MQEISIDEIIDRGKKLRTAEKAVAGKAPEPGEKVAVKLDAIFDELAYIKKIESDFTLEVDGLLETMHLSHLRVVPQK
jgi:hypothetical protein